MISLGGAQLGVGSHGLKREKKKLEHRAATIEFNKKRREGGILSIIDELHICKCLLLSDHNCLRETEMAPPQKTTCA